MNVGEKAFKELYPKKKPRKVTVKYSKAFKPYNANVSYTNNAIAFSFSNKWKDVSEEIQIGLAQHLLLKVFREKKRTLNIELYEKFLEKVTKYAENNIGEAHPELEESFNRVNDKYFHDFMELPGLEWGSHSTTQLGTYTYHTDTIRISRIFQDLPAGQEWLLDYVMYHELLHKRFGLKHGKEGSCKHHPPAFKKLEREFHVPRAEKQLDSYVNIVRRGKKMADKGFLVTMRNLFK